MYMAKALCLSLVIFLFSFSISSKEIITHCNLTKKEIAQSELKGAKLIDVSFNQEGQRCASFLNLEKLNKGLPPKKPIVYDDFDSPDNNNLDPKDDGILVQLKKMASSNPEIIKYHEIGYSHQKRPIVALQIGNNNITQNRILLVGLHHAREWVTTDLLMRFLYLVIDPSNQDIRDLLQNIEVWVIPVINPDGYQYTFTPDGQNWRKNMRDNNNNGIFEPNLDGVDLNRNYDYLWSFDEWGASSMPSSWTYRGKSPFSEPETLALKNLMLEKHFSFAISYHTYGNLILYPTNYLPSKRPADWPLFTFLAGTKDTPAIYDSSLNSKYSPMMGSELYTTNGDFDDWAYHVSKTIPFTIELTNLEENSFNYPDDEKLLQTVFADNLPFIVDLMKSGANPESPSSHINSKLQDFLHEPITQSYGQIQTLEVFSRKGKTSRVHFYNNETVPDKYRTLSPTDQGIYFDIQQTKILNESGVVHYWFETLNFEGNSVITPQSGTYKFTIQNNTNNKILLVSAELGDQAQRPKYLPQYLHLLKEANLENKFDIIIKNPSEILGFFEILSHYDLIIWYTGDNNFPWDYGQEFEINRFIRDAHGKFLFSGNLDNGYLNLPNTLSALENLLFYGFGIESHMTGLGATLLNESLTIASTPDDIFLKGKSIKLNPLNKNDKMGMLRPSKTYQSSLSHGFISSDKGFTYLKKNPGVFSTNILSSPITLPSLDSSLTFQIGMIYMLEEVVAFLEIHNVDDGKRSSISPSSGICEYDAPGMQTVNPEDLNSIPDLKPYYDEFGHMRRLSDGSAALKVLCWTDGGYANAKFDLSPFKGQNIEIRLVFVDFGAESLAGDTGVVTDFLIPELPLIILPVTHNGNWNKGLINLPLTPMVTTDQTVFLTFGFEDMENSTEQFLLFENILGHLF